MGASTSPTWLPESLAEAPGIRSAGSQTGERLAFGDAAAALLDGCLLENAAYWRGMLEKGPVAMADNFAVRAGVVRSGNDAFPVAVHDGARGMAFPCSLHTQYVAYPRDELSLVPDRRQRALARVGLAALDALFRIAGLDHSVQWSGWLLSTNLHPPGLKRAIRPVTRCLAQAFPRHAILVRNLHALEDPELPDAFVEAGYAMAASRRIYFFDGRTRAYLAKETVRRDLKALARLDGYTQVEHADFTEADVPRITELYRQIYVEKHSRLNPRYTEGYVARALRERWMEFRGLRHSSGRLDGVFACFSEGNTTSTPFIGHETRLPDLAPLYRHLFTMLLQRIGERGQLLNYSSGAGEFKRRRGAEAVVESNVVYLRHLSAGRRAAFGLFLHLLERHGRPFLEKNDI